MSIELDIKKVISQNDGSSSLVMVIKGQKDVPTHASGSGVRIPTQVLIQQLTKCFEDDLKKAIGDFKDKALDANIPEESSW